MYKLNFGCLVTCIPHSVCFFMLVCFVPFRQWVIIPSVEAGNKDIQGGEQRISACDLLYYSAGLYKIFSSMMYLTNKDPQWKQDLHRVNVCPTLCSNVNKSGIVADSPYSMLWVNEKWILEGLKVPIYPVYINCVSWWDYNLFQM